MAAQNKTKQNKTKQKDGYHLSITIWIVIYDQLAVYARAMQREKNIPPTKKYCQKLDLWLMQLFLK
jgi:hypothetical protein